jgi:hypothetical protein
MAQHLWMIANKTGQGRLSLLIGRLLLHITRISFVQRPSSSGVEQRIENPRVGGSNPPSGTSFCVKKSCRGMILAKTPVAKRRGAVHIWGLPC